MDSITEKLDVVAYALGEDGMTTLESHVRGGIKEIEKLRAINDMLMTHIAKITSYAKVYAEIDGRYLTEIADMGNYAFDLACKMENA